MGKKNLFLKIVICCCLVLTSKAQAIGTDIFEQPVSIEFSNSELWVVFKELSDDVGIQIIYDKKISKKIVSGFYQKKSFITVIQRLLGGVSHSLTMDEQTKVLLIKSFGEANYVTTGTTPGSEYITDIGMPFSELKALHRKQYEEYVEETSDMATFLEEVGMTRGDLRDLHERQSNQFNFEKNDASQYLTELNMTRGQLEDMRKKQLAEFNYELNDEGAVLSELGITLGEHRTMLVGQASAFEKQQKDGAEYLSEIGMTRGEHQRLLSEQQIAFQKNLAN